MCVTALTTTPTTILETPNFLYIDDGYSKATTPVEGNLSIYLSFTAGVKTAV